VVHPANGLGEHVANLQNLEFRARLQVLLLRDGVGGDDLVNRAGIDALDGVAREHAVCDECIHSLGAFLLEKLGRACDGVRGISQVIDEDGGAAAHFTDKQHGGVLTIRNLRWAAFLNFVRRRDLPSRSLSAYLVDERKVCAQSVCDVRCALCAASVRADDHTVVGSSVLGDDVLLNVLFQHVPTVEVVDWDVEEALVLRVVQVHGDDVVRAGAGEEVGNESTSLSHPHLVSALNSHLRRASGLAGSDRGRVAGDGVSIVLGDRIGTRGIRLVAIQCVLPLGTRALLQRKAGQLLCKRSCAATVADSLAFRAAGVWARRPRVEGVGRVSVNLGGHPCQWRADLVVGQIALARVREERQDCGDSSCACGLACAQGDEELHEVVIDLAAAGLYDVDILIAHAVADLDPSLSISELLEFDVGRRDAEVGADVVCELGVGGATEDNNIPHHVCCVRECRGDGRGEA
jgi:hypothetical protein